MEKKEKKKVLLFGYSKANFGDDLFVYILANRYQEVEFFIHIKEEKYKKAFQGLKNLTLLEQERNVNEVDINQYDAFIYVGGSIFIESDYAKHEAKAFNQFIQKIKEQGKPFFYMTCNFGPYQSEEYLNMVKENLKMCKGVSFREKSSYELFKEIPNVSYAPDMAFSYDYRSMTGKREKKRVGITIIDLSIREKLRHKEGIYNDYMKRIIIKFAKRGYKVSLISFCEFEEDKKAIEKIKQMIPEEYQKNVEELNYEGNIEAFLKEYSKINYMVCIRFHSMILSIILKQRVYNLLYSDKTKNVIKDYKLFRKFDTIENLQYETILRKYHFRKVNGIKLRKIKQKSEGQYTAFENWLKS